MTAAYRHQSLCSFIELALPAIEALDTPQRAECYDGIRIACETDAPELALAAQHAAEALRDADSRQLKLRLLLTEKTKS